jgi:hypothetical protein
MPVILATQEAEIRIPVRSQPGQLVCKTLVQTPEPSKNKKQNKKTSPVNNIARPFGVCKTPVPVHSITEGRKYLSK